MIRGCQFDDQLMKHFVLAVFSTFVFGTVLFAQSLVENSPVQSLTLPAQGAEVVPNSNVTIYEKPPSRLIGNTFNRPIGAVTPEYNLKVEDTLLVPSIGGNQLWLKVTPEIKDGSLDANLPDSCTKEGCWTYYGQIGTSGGLPQWQSDSKNFDVTPRTRGE